MDIYFITPMNSINGKDKNGFNNLNWVHLKYFTIVWGLLSVRKQLFVFKINFWYRGLNIGKKRIGLK